LSSGDGSFRKFDGGEELSPRVECEPERDHDNECSRRENELSLCGRGCRAKGTGGEATAEVE
jgi:hypothetical protein